MNSTSGNRLNRLTAVASLLFAFIALSGLHDARAELLFYEGFDYPVGQKLGEFSSSTNWGNPKDQFTVVSGSLDYPGLLAPTGNRVNMKAATANLDSVRTVDGLWPEQSSGVLYVSFILRLHSNDEITTANVGTSLINLADTPNNTELFGINLRSDGGMRLGVVKYPSTSKSISSSAFFDSGPGANLSVDGSTTYFVVAKYEWVDGETNDVVTLWVNPSTLGGDEDAGNRIITSTGRDGPRGSARLILCRGPNVNLDELRIGNTWHDVAPILPPPRSHVATVVLLACGLLAASFWILVLRRKVKERSAALKAQIQERQKVEQQRLVEQERARIAHDLHDELGADITEISMLATRANGGAGGGEEARRCLVQLTDKSRQMVAKLEEIVWAMDPRHDSFEALVSYLSFYADRFLGLANIKLTIETSAGAAKLAVEARVRHQLFLACKEALVNVVRHSGASEVQLIIRGERRNLQVTVADNGRGLGLPDPTSGAHEGLANMRRRMENIGGQFEITGDKAQGTTVRFSVPLES